MKKICIALAAFLLAASAFVLFKCKARDKMIKFEADSEQTLWGEWIVVTKPFAKCFDVPAGKSESGFVRIAEIHEVKSRKMRSSDGKTEIWYRLENGWISEGDIKTFPTFAAAKNASDALMSKRAAQ